MPKIGLMGGTFDPIHIGHLIAATCAKEAADLDEVWFIPTASPPLKPNPPIATEQQRFQMVELATKEEPAFRAVDIELRRGGTSYSIDTLSILRQQFIDHQFYYIIGSDRINDLPQWHRAEELLEMTEFIGLNRPSQALQIMSLPSQWQRKIVMAPMPLIDISSTELRRRVSEGKSLRYYVTDQVEQYIRRFALYE